MEAEIRPLQVPLVRRLEANLSKYLAVFRVSVASNMAYSLAILFRALNMGVIVFVLSQLWHTTFALRGQTQISGYQAGDLIWYLIATEVLAMSLPPIGRTIDLEVRSGQLAYMLGRPCSYILYHFSSYIGERIVRIGVNILVGCVLALIMVGPPHFSLWNLLGFIPVAFLAISIDFVCYFLIGLLA
ncbi:MAG TPA: hypothetical protein VFN23_15090, partial [Ktedonobacteraceae bacterium]|nr:hypothetical protein [Ktedonobacteraceae bacterium]